MSSAKETPRQKMISMMYLVLTCLLAINVSREVLDGFVTINESIEVTNSSFTSNTKKIMLAFDDAIQQGHHECRPYYAKAKTVTQLSQGAYDYVEKVKKEVVRFTENREGADTLQLKDIERLDDFDRPTFFLIGSDELKPKEEEYSAKDLRNTLTRLTDSLNLMIDGMKDKDGLKLPTDDYFVLKDKIRLFTPHDHFKDKEGKPITWECKNFYNMPLAAVVTNLSKIQGDIRNIEAELVNSFASASGKLSVKFNQMQARIVPVSSYVQAGTPYNADVFLTASSSDFKEDNLQFILGDVDTASGKIAADAKVLPIESGTGKISLPTGGGVGSKKINGWIKFREGTGTYKYFKYENEYTVANSAVAVSPDKMNVFYAGVDNPITVSAAGVAPTNLVVKINGCNATLSDQGNGKYLTRVSGIGTTTVTVFEKKDGGLKAQGAPQVFRVKRIPNPALRVGNKITYGNLEMKVIEAKNINGISVDNSGFDFVASFKVKEFTMTVVVNGQGLPEVTCKGGQMSLQAKDALSKIKSGSKIFIENIKIEAPDGSRDFPMVKIVVR
jgi:gliding motility-associated protein GldM